MQTNNDQTGFDKIEKKGTRQGVVLFQASYIELQTLQAKVRVDNEYLETWVAGSWLDGDPPVLQVPVITFMGVGGVKYGGKDFYL